MEELLTLPEYLLGDERSLLSEQNRELASIVIDLDIREEGLISAIAASDFSNLNVFMQLNNMETGHLVAIEKPLMLDEVYTENDAINMFEDETVIRDQPDEPDHISSLELSNIKPGHYQLKLSIPTAFWWPMNRHGTHCLNFNFVLEFIPKSDYKRSITSNSHHDTRLF